MNKRMYSEDVGVAVMLAVMVMMGVAMGTGLGFWLDEPEVIFETKVETREVEVPQEEKIRRCVDEGGTFTAAKRDRIVPKGDWWETRKEYDADCIYPSRVEDL